MIDSLLKNEPLAPYTSWKVGGGADFFILPQSIEELQKSIEWAQANKLPFCVISGGTNVLINDQGLRGLVICLKKLKGLEIDLKSDFLRMSAYAGTPKGELMKVFLKHELAPAVFLAGIPGHVGGGVVMNAGVGELIRPREFSEIVDWVEVLKEDGSVVRYQGIQINWSYRNSSGWQPGVICRVGFKWENVKVNGLRDQVVAANKKRLEKQPLGEPSCGSTFVNPQGHSAGALIDQCGLKGMTIGGAQVSHKHANFIINTGHATANDIHQLIMLVQKRVFEKFQIQLKTEVRYLGFD